MTESAPGNAARVSFDVLRDDVKASINRAEFGYHELTDQEADAVLAVVVDALRTLAPQWSSSDLMDAAAWIEGTL